jgi:two-component system, cell cycle response regulator CpdR
VARIVIAEDQAHIRNVLAMWMQRNGHEVLQAETGTQALELLRENEIDLLITDVNMPEMNGIELTRHAFGACGGLKGVFVVTSRCDQHEIISQFSDKRIYVYPKPFSPSQLLQEVERAMNSECRAPAVGAGEVKS